MTFRTTTLAALALFTIACADEAQTDADDINERAALPEGLDGIANSTDGDGSADEGDVIVADDIPRLAQGLMQDIYDADDDCVPGATILGNFDGNMVSGKALDNSWRTAAIITAELGTDDVWTGEWTGVSEEEVDPNGAGTEETESGGIEGIVDVETESFTGTIDLGDGAPMDIDGYWVHQSELSGFFFGVASDCE